MRKSFPAVELERALGARPVDWEPVASRGYGRNTAHWRALLDDGRRVFAKDALDEVSAAWLRREHVVYRGTPPAFHPVLLGWHDDRGRTVLAIEDAGEAHWPPPWRDGEVEAVLATLAEVRAAAALGGVPRLEDDRARLNGWEDVAADPAPLLATGLCSEGWLERALPELLHAARTCTLAGDDLIHGDVRSDNLCIRDGRVLLVDWNHACVGNGLFDVVAWLPSLRLEGGPEPRALVRDSGGIAALVAGFFAGRAGLPPPPTAPTVREFQRAQAAVALPWAAAELGVDCPA